MFNVFLSPVRLLVQGFLETDSPRQLSAGLALGMMLGLLPKGNLVAIVLAILLLGTQANLIAGALGTALFSWIGLATDAWANSIGLWLLQHPALQSHWARLYDLPLAPWTNFNNTLVLGNLLVGLAFALPLYLVSRWLTARCRPWVVAKLKKYRIDRILGQVQTVASFHISSPVAKSQAK